MRCWYTRWQMSNALDDGDLESRLTRGHAARCAACQAFGRRLEALDAQLATGAPAAAEPVAEPREARARRRWLIAGPLAFGAAAAVAVAVTGVRPVERVVDPEGPVSSVGTLVRVRRVADQVSRMLSNTPLETELEDLLHDGKRGLEAVLALGGLR